MPRRFPEINVHPFIQNITVYILFGNLPKYTEHKCQKHVFTWTAGLTAIPLGNSITLTKHPIFVYIQY